MSSHLRSFSLALLIAVLLPLSIAASPSPAPSLHAEPPQLQPPFTGMRANTDTPIGVMIELWDAPVLVSWASARRTQSLASATQVARTQARSLDLAQQQLLPQIAQAGGQVLYRLQRTLNGVAAYVPPDQLAELSRLPSVRSIRPLIPKVLDNSISVPLIGAPQLWSAAVPVRGEGIKVGVIDTGIDYLHTNFGGSGRAADYTRNNTTVITDELGFPNVKVVGGFDFAGDAYNASQLDTFFPTPDPDPMDCAGHGTHVAGTLGGYGVNANGSTYRGPWNATAVPTATMRIGPGVAPQVQLYAMRIFGCVGTTALIAWSLEWATDPNGDFEFGDHLDVVNLSLGAPFGGPGPDSDTEAANNAALAGVIVVASAGNSGDTFFNVSTPSTATWAISVASSFDSTAITDALRASAPASISGLYPATEIRFGYDMATSGPLTGTLSYPSSSQSNGCLSFNTANAALLRGRIALIDRGICSIKTKVRNAQVAGAAGALIVNHVPGYPSEVGNDPTITDTIRIPAMLTTQATGTIFKAHLSDPGGVRVTLTAAYRNGLTTVDQNMVDAISYFSARGPRRVDGALKPDVTAPGDTIFSSKSGTGNGGVSFSGTSMAAPHVAGTMALLRQIHPDWSVEELKALLMNTASVRARANGQSGALFSPSRQGAGRIALLPASQAGTVAYNADTPGLVSISFGFPQVVGSTTLVRNVRVVNKRNIPATFNIGMTNVVTASGVTLSVTPAQVTLPAYGSSTFAVLATIDAAALDRTLDPATASTQEGAARQFLNEHSGYLTLNGPDTLTLPFYLAPRPAATLHAAGPLSFPLTQSAATLTLRGQGLASAAYRSRVWALELQEFNINDAITQGIQEAGDMKYIGIGSDVAPAGGLRDDSLISFGIATFAPWSSATVLDTRFLIYIDTNDDKVADFALINWSLAEVRGGTDANDVFLATLVNVRNNTVISTRPINGLTAASGSAPYNTSVIVLPVRAGDLGLKPGRSRFNYSVIAFTREYPGPSDFSGIHSFDPAAPALSLGGAPLLDAANGTTAQVRINRGSWMRDEAQGLLLLHELNAVPVQAEFVPVTVGFRQAFLPWVGQ